MPPLNILPSKTSNLRAYLLLVLTMACWGMNAVLGRVAVGEVSPMTLVFLSWAVAVLILLFFTWRHLIRDWPVIRRHLLYFLIMGGLGYSAFNLLFYVAAHSTSAINIGIIQGGIPVFVLIGAFVMFRTRVTPLQMVGVVITIIGVAIVAGGGSFERLASLEINKGDALLLLAAAFYAGYTVGLRFRPELSPITFFMVVSIAAMLTSAPFALLEIAMGDFLAPTLTGWTVILLAALLASILSQITYIIGVSIIGPGRAGVFVNLVPIFAAIFAVTYLGEPFEMFHAIALVCVLTGIWISERGKPPA